MNVNGIFFKLNVVKKLVCNWDFKTFLISTEQKNNPTSFYIAKNDDKNWPSYRCKTAEKRNDTITLPIKFFANKNNDNQK